LNSLKVIGNDAVGYLRLLYDEKPKNSYVHSLSNNIISRLEKYFIKTCEAGLVLSVTRTLRAALTKFRVHVCMYVCVCNYSFQTTEPICIKIIPANRASYADCYRVLRFEIFTLTVFKTPKNHFWEPHNVKPMENRSL